MINLLKPKNNEYSWKVDVGCDINHYKNSELSSIAYRF